MNALLHDSATRALISSSLEDVDPLVAGLIDCETEQQFRKLMLVASVSAAPRAVLDALGSVLQNVCAEGYPAGRMMRDAEPLLRDVEWQLAPHRRYSDRRFYKGLAYVNLVESLAQRRCAELFAHGALRPEAIHVNVQSFSGATANMAVYQALMAPGDTLMGMSLHEGGHLTHGSRLNASGQHYRVASYAVDPVTERLDYEAIRALARQHRPRVIVAGFTSYPWAPDWEAFRAIADEVGAYLVADIAHTAGLAVAGAFPNPVGIAHVTTLTTNKTLCGPRGAVVISTDEHLARRIDQAVFPGEQGAPHPNQFAAMAVAFHIAQGEAFRQMQHQIVANARALAHGLSGRGLRLAYGGTDTHLMVIDLKSLPSPTGFPLWGEPAARILDLAGLVVNKNGLPGDREAALYSGIRLGTPWITQRGLEEPDMEALAGLIHRVVANIRPFAYRAGRGLLPRGKIALEVLEEVRRGVAALVEKTDRSGLDAENPTRHGRLEPAAAAVDGGALRIVGWRARQFLQQATTADITRLAPGESVNACVLDGSGQLIDRVTVSREKPDDLGRDQYLLCPSPQRLSQVAAWLQGLADGYTLFDPADVFRKVEGPVVIKPASALEVGPHGAIPVDGHGQAPDWRHADSGCLDLQKTYFVGQSALQAQLAPSAAEKKAAWQWVEPPVALKRTALFNAHTQAGAKMAPFAGWEMPLWYSSALEEHRAVREAAGLFDVMHMGVFEVSGPQATTFLDAVFSNYAAGLEDGCASYGFMLDPDGQVLDDAILYRLQADRYLLVVNAANEDKDWDWLNAVNEQRIAIDRTRPWVQVGAPAVLRNLKQPDAGPEQKSDLALQGPASLRTLQALTGDLALQAALSGMRRMELLTCELAGVPLVVARTGYTGEALGYELFLHPDNAPHLWSSILAAGDRFGVKPAGLAARDSIRTEAGLPLWGHELAGSFDISPLEAGMPGFVKYHKPFFVGRDVLLAREHKSARQVVRFRVNERGVRPPRPGDSVCDLQGSPIGTVTSCSIGADRHLLGMALLQQEALATATPVTILSPGARDRRPDPARAGSLIGATVLTRFLQPAG